ncbi:MAG: hypothetical protein HYY01_03140 [Chloroflexi bacterium]|nr:hypothetical protein [Chloroflexota bacterium]
MVTERPRPRRRGVLVLVVVLVLAFLAMFVYAFQSTVLVRRAGIPEKVGELELVSKVEGEAAIAQVGRLHGTDIALKDAYIAKYAHSGLQLTAWVGKAEDTTAAAELLRRMVEGINRGGSPFSNLRQQRIEDQGVYQVDGPGGRHYFYASDNKVIWLTLEGTGYQTLLPIAVSAF